MKYIKLPNGDKLECYSCDVTNSCIIKFINTDLKIVKDFFGQTIIDFIDYIDEEKQICHQYNIYAKQKSIIVENTTIPQYEKRMIKEAWTETIEIQPIEGSDNTEIKYETIEHPTEIETIEKQVQVEMITAILEKPDISEEIENVKSIIGIVNTNNMNLDEFKEYYIALSNEKLKEYLSDNPLLSTCHRNTAGIYNITKDKQDLMTSNYLTYTIKKSLNPNAVLTWNESGEECEVWTEEEYLQLIVEIEAIVKPLVAYQQSIEKQIIGANDLESIKSISLDYSVADIRNSSDGKVGE